MRVLHLAPTAPGTSGIADYAARFRTAVAAHGVQIESVSPPPGHGDTMLAVARHAHSVRTAARGFDVVHAELGAGVVRDFHAALAVAHDGRVPLCLTIHEAPRPVWWPFYFRSVRLHLPCRLAARGLLRSAGRALERELMSRADATFVFSRIAAEAVQRELPEASLPDLLTPPGPIAPAEDGSASTGPDLPVIGFFGFWYPSKGLELLVDALAALRDEGAPLHARLWGDVPPGTATHSYRQHVLGELARRGLGAHVETPGWLPGAEVPTALAGCSAIVLPYEDRASTRGLVSTSAALVEALSAGVPAIASNSRALPELVHDGDNGMLFPAGDLSALADRLRRLRDDHDLRARLRAGAHAWRLRFDPSRTAEEALAVYRRVIRGHSPRTEAAALAFSAT